MAKEKKLVEAITSMEEDFAQWYTDVVKKAELCGYTSVKGCMVIKPAGYAIWENIQNELDRRFKRNRCGKCLHASVYSGVPSSERKGPCRRICAGGCMGHPWRPGPASRSVSVYVRLLKHCSVIFIRRKSSPTGSAEGI